jgi:uncharacterized protein with ParB-like and HNH nuclease domain
MTEPEELTVKKLLHEHKYIIPYYQRNYAWEYPEINQLLNDIRDSIKKPSSSDAEKSYYLGTLVVAEKDILGEKYFEIVDGQQRHTTLSIIHAVLSKNDKKNRNLYFEARNENEAALDIMFGQKESNELIGSSSFYSAKQIIEQFLNEMQTDNDIEKKTDLVEFRDFFYNNVKIFMVVLPKETDLNHYFEVMNNRGEQLEQHEILKARLMDKIQDTALQHIFSVIWDACSDMNGFAIQKTPADKRKNLYDEDFSKIPTLETILSLKKQVISSTASNLQQDNEESAEEKWNFDAIIKNHKLDSNFNQKTTSKDEFRFSSVIDFPNFLLHVRKLSKPSVKLDDKFLLEAFDDIKNEESALNFIVDLIRTRILFDNYIIKREKGDSNWNWSLLRYTNDNSHPYKYSITGTEVGKSLKMLQSMYHVTFTANNYKNWLYESLQFLTESHSNGSINGEDFLNKLYDSAVNRMKEYPNFYFMGLNTPRFVFNFIDYLLWKEYFDNVRGEDTIEQKEGLLYRIFKLKQKFYSFKFVQRSSIEHLFPQSRISELIDSEKGKETTMNSLGNLCLISKSVNSFLNNHLPYQKKNDSLLRNSIESLKQLIMFETFTNEVWNSIEIEKHHKEIEDLLS